MARPRSEEKRNALMAAATRVIAMHGMGAPTALIAQEAGVANGSLFTYFGTKADLLNHLYLELKAGQASAVLARLPVGAELREQLAHMWSQWMSWATSSPEKRRALAQLDVSDEITPASRVAAYQAMADIAALVEKSRANGPLRDAPMGFVVAIMSALADTTVDVIIRDPANADTYCKIGFDALWRVIADCASEAVAHQYQAEASWRAETPTPAMDVGNRKEHA